MNDRLPLGILSAAHVHTPEYAELLNEFDDVTFIGIADNDEQRGRKTAEEYGTGYLPTDDLVNAVEGVVVCSPNDTHDQWIEQAADADVDILCEKPLATDYDQAQSIVDTCRNADVNAGLVMPLRFNPLAMEAKKQVDEDTVGDIKFITGTNRGKMPGSWFIDPDLAGGGAVMDHTVHILNLVRWITGQEVAEVYCESGTKFWDIPVDDVNVLSAELEDGTPFTLDGSWSRPEEYDRWGDATLTVVGTNGALSIDSTEQALKHTRDGGDDPGIRQLGVGSDPNRGSLRNFITAIKNNCDPLSTVEDGAREVAVVEAAYKSIERSDAVTVEY